jgi:hypothetical protein
VLKGACLFQRLKFIHNWQPTNSHKLKLAKSDNASIGLCPGWKTTLEDHNHVLRCPSQASTRYMELQDIRSSIEQTKSPADPVLWSGLQHWLSNPSIPLSMDTSRYSGRTKLLVQQALHEQARIGWDKAFSRLPESHAGPTRESPQGSYPLQQKSTIQCVGDFDAHQSRNVQQGHVERPLHETP